MSDYLGNLITRTFSQGSIVRPRLPSLFEKAAADYSPGLALAQEVTQRAESAPKSQLKPVAHSLDRSEQSQLAGAMPVDLAPEQPSPAPVLAPTKNSSSSVTTASAISAIHLPRREAIKPVQPLAGEDPNRGRHLEPAPDNGIRKSSDKQVTPQPLPLPESKAEMIAAQPHKHSSSEERIESHAPVRPSSEATIAIVPRATESTQRDFSDSDKSAVRPKDVRAVEAIVPLRYSPSQNPSSPSRVAEPAVNITIGRVEIRATTSPTRLQSAQPKSGKVLSLESYLRQRAKGDRR